MERPSDRILKKLSVAMARGILVIDENVSTLVEPLSKLNIRILEPPKGMSDADIMKYIIANRTIVTKNSKDFVDWASSYDFGIIALDNLSFIDSEPDETLNKTVKMISNAISKYSVWSKRHGFIILLKDNGNHEYKELTE